MYTYIHMIVTITNCFFFKHEKHVYRMNQSSGLFGPTLVLLSACSSVVVLWYSCLYIEWLCITPLPLEPEYPLHPAHIHTHSDTAATNLEMHHFEPQWPYQQSPFLKKSMSTCDEKLVNGSLACVVCYGWYSCHQGHRKSTLHLEQCTIVSGQGSSALCWGWAGRRRTGQQPERFVGRCPATSPYFDLWQHVAFISKQPA